MVQLVNNQLNVIPGAKEPTNYKANKPLLTFEVYANFVEDDNHLGTMSPVDVSKEYITKYRCFEIDPDKIQLTRKEIIEKQIIPQ